MGIVSNFERLRDAWASVDLVKEVTIIASNNTEKIAGYNKEQLYKEGEDSTGKKLRKYRSKKYARVKNQMNPAPGLGNPDLFVTGSFHESIFSAVKQGKIIFDADDSKVEKLVSMFGEEIFGLQQENNTRVWVEVLRAPLLPRINSITGSNLI
jgi:hypothetical protein